MFSKKTKFKSDHLNRSAINVFSLVVTLCALGIAVTIADGSFSHRINQISRRLDERLQKVLDEIVVDYQEIDINATYSSSPKFHERGMGGLYNLTKLFMDWTIPVDFLPKGKLHVYNVKKEQTPVKS